MYFHKLGLGIGIYTADNQFDFWCVYFYVYTKSIYTTYQKSKWWLEYIYGGGYD